MAKTCFNVDTLTLDGFGFFSVIDECSQGLDNLGLESLSGPCIRCILLFTLNIVSLCMRNTYAYFSYLAFLNQIQSTILPLNHIHFVGLHR